jgi:DNA-binding protein HU-beta
MNKSELINAICEETTFSKKDVSRVMAAFDRVAKRTLQKGVKLSMTGFGTFWVSRRPARNGINPSTKERISLPETNVPRFKPGKVLKEMVRSVKLSMMK